MTKIIYFLKNLLSFFYPRLCPCCHQAMQQNEHHLCISCLIHLPETDYHRHLQNPLSFIFTGRIPVEHVAALLFYKKGNHVQKILHSLKYKGNRDLGVFLGCYYGRILAKESIFDLIDYILPVPLHPQKLKERGYNQSECIAKGLGLEMHKPYYTDILIRVGFTGTQTNKDRIERWENVESVFEVTDQEKVKGKTILLCDDVLTTGATMEAAARPLLRCENVKIYIVALATAL